MPTFYMHIYADGELIEDIEGQSHPNVEDAIAEAKASVREMLAEKVRLGEEVDGQRIEIVDEQGRSVGTIPFRTQLRLRPERVA